jgi:hypothetical protein
VFCAISWIYNIIFTPHYIAVAGLIEACPIKDLNLNME